MNSLLETVILNNRQLMPYFDGVDDGATVSSNAAFDVATEDMTVEIVVANMVDTGALQQLAAKGTLGSGGAVGWDLLFRSDLSGNYAQFRIADGVNQGLANLTGINLSDGRSHHIAVTVNRTSNLLTMFVDGQDGTPASIVGVGSMANANQFTLGRRSASAQWYAQGNLLEFRLWKGVARTQAEILSTMFRRLNGNEAGLALYLPMNEGTGTIFYDKSPNGNNATVTGASWQRNQRVVRR